MIRPSTVSPEAKDYIQTKLNALAARENIQILFAIESGSRAWGFPSADSDYDVRFVYIRRQSDYLSVRELRDVIETPLENDAFLGVPLDLNGWDIRKALRLGLNSNPVLHEWLVSPIRYIGDADSLASLKQLVAVQCNKEILCYHYDRLARRVWDELEADTLRVKVKLYCYMLRPALMLRWLSKNISLPPMDVASLCEDIDQHVASSLAELFAIKYASCEIDLIDRRPILDDLIAKALANKAVRPNCVEIGQEAIIKADQVFTRLLSKPSS